MAWHSRLWGRGGVALVVCASAVGCNGHRVIIGDSAGEDFVETEPFPDLPELPEADLPPGCNNGVLEPGDVCLVPEYIDWAGIDPCDISVGDFDQDGRPDAAVPNSDFLREEEPDHVANVLYGRGEYVSTAVPHAAGGPLPVSVVTLDFDGDGWDDLAVGNSSDGTITRLRNAGLVVGGSDDAASRNTFQEEVIDLHSEVVGTVGAGDLDGDGRDELLVPLAGAESLLMVIWPDGEVSAYATPEPVVEIAADDLDRDGLDDIVVVTTLGSLQSLRCEAQSCEATHTLETEAFGFGELRMEDMDRDGFLDAVYTAVDEVGGVVGLAKGHGDGAFSTWTKLSQPFDFGLRGLVIEDFDHDNLPDLVLTEATQDEVSVLRGVDFGVFEPVSLYETGQTPIAAASADFDGDGLTDVAVALQHANQVQLFMSRP